MMSARVITSRPRGPELDVDPDAPTPDDPSLHLDRGIKRDEPRATHLKAGLDQPGRIDVEVFEDEAKAFEHSPVAETVGVGNEQVIVPVLARAVLMDNIGHVAHPTTERPGEDRGGD